MESGCFHATPQGHCPWQGFAEAIFQYFRTIIKLMPATSADFLAKIPPSGYWVLDKEPLRKAGLDIITEQQIKLP